MSTCLFGKENSDCGLATLGVRDPEKAAPNTAYCEQCSNMAFRCPDGHWNRAFAQYCTHCAKKLEKPAIWEMAFANPQRTATLPTTSKDVLKTSGGFGTWAVDIPEIVPSGNLPSLLAVDGLILVPNPSAKKLDAYSIAKPAQQESLTLVWSVSLNTVLTSGLTPIYHGLHFYCVTAGAILKQPALGGKAKPTKIHGVDTANIQPIPRCAPLKCTIKGSPFLIVGLKGGVLLLNLTQNSGDYIQHAFFNEDTVTSPVLCGDHVVFTNLAGQIFSLNIEISPYKIHWKTFKNISFSVPISIGKLVYFEALADNGERSLARYRPISDQLSKVATLDTEPKHTLANRRRLFMHPPLTDNRSRVFLADRFGRTVYAYDYNTKVILTHALPGDDNERFVTHQSLVVNSQIYSAHRSGLTILDFEGGFNVSHQFLAMGRPTNPIIVLNPIRYGDKLFILCRDRLLCMDLGN